VRFQCGSNGKKNKNKANEGGKKKEKKKEKGALRLNSEI